MQTLYPLLKKPDIDFYIPPSPLQFNPLQDDMSKIGRDYVIQGETLHFFLIVKLGRLFEGVLPRTQGDVTTDDSSKPEMQSETSSHETTAAHSQEGSVNTDDLGDNIHSPAYRQRLRTLFSNLEIRVEFMKVKTKLQDQFKPNAAVNEDSPVGVEDIKHIFKEQPIEAVTSGCLTLANGDIVYPLQLGVSIKKEFVNRKVSLTAVIHPPEYKMGIDQLISPLYTERSAIRAVAFPVTVLEPLLIAPTTTKMGTTTLASVVITNTHKEVVTILNANVSTHSIIPTRFGAIDTQDFDVDLEKDEFPLLLHPNESYNLIFLMKPSLPLALVQIHNLQEFAQSSLHLSWRTPSLCGEMLSPVEIPTVKTKTQKIMMTIDVGSSPIPLNSIFAIQLTIHNLANSERNLLVDLPLPVLDISNDRFFKDYTKKDPKKLIINRTQTTEPESQQAPAAEPSVTVSSADPPKPEGTGEQEASFEVSLDAADETTDQTTGLAPRLQRSSKGKSEASTKNVPERSEKRKTNNKDKKKSSKHKKNPEDDKNNGFQELSNLLDQYNLKQRETSTIMCLDKIIHFGVVPAKGQKTVKVQCLAMGVGLFTLSGVRILDTVNKKAYVVDENCEIVVI